MIVLKNMMLLFGKMFIVKFLIKQSTLNKSNKIKMTHQKIANSIGTSRVVISRLLKKLEVEGKVSLLNREIVVH